MSKSTDITNIIAAFSSVISAFGLLLLSLQVYLLWKQLANDNKRSRRERAVNAVSIYTQQLQRETASARKLVEKFNDEQARDLFEEKELSLNANCRSLVESCLLGTNLPIHDLGNGEIKLDIPATAVIRWQVVTYLNSLEVVMSAWYHNLAERAIVEEEFSYIIDDTKGYTALEKFRKACCGKERFPAIEAFAFYIREQKNQVAPGSPPIKP